MKKLFQLLILMLVSAFLSSCIVLPYNSSSDSSKSSSVSSNSSSISSDSSSFEPTGSSSGSIGVLSGEFIILQAGYDINTSYDYWFSFQVSDGDFIILTQSPRDGLITRHGQGFISFFIADYSVKITTDVNKKLLGTKRELYFERDGKEYWKVYSGYNETISGSYVNTQISDFPELKVFKVS